MQGSPIKALQRPSDPLVISYLVQLAGEMSSTQNRNLSLQHADSSVKLLRNDSSARMRNFGDNTEHGNAGYLAQLASQLQNPFTGKEDSQHKEATWRQILCCCLPGT